MEFNTPFVMIKLIILINSKELTMETLNATEAKRVFGDVLIKAQRSPISINKNGKPVAVIMSSAEYQQLQEMKENQLKAALQQGVEDLAAGRVIDGKQVMTELRQSIT